MGADLATAKGRWWVRAVLCLMAAATGFCCFLVYTRPSYYHLVLTFTDCDSFPGGVVTAGSDGRLGNNMAEYATIYAIAVRYNMTTVANPRLLRTMAAVFPSTSLAVVEEYCVRRYKPVPIGKFLAMADDKKRAGRWKIMYFPQRIRLFWYYRDSLIREFRFRDDLAEYTATRLSSVAAGRQNLTFVGVHVRRTDYAHHLDVVIGGHLVNASFFHSALELCRQRYHQPVFIVTSDDLPWCREHLSAPDVHILGDKRAESPGVEQDLALLAACNHTVFDYGTYGFFAAFLAGGDLILADGYGKKEDKLVTELRKGNITATFLDGNGQLLAKCVHC